jgi:hypothetical protein
MQIRPLKALIRCASKVPEKSTEIDSFIRLYPCSREDFDKNGFDMLTFILEHSFASIAGDLPVKKQNCNTFVVTTLLLSLGFSNSAGAFNVHNSTPFSICVFGNKGNYSDIVGPGETNQGWNFDESITLSISPRDSSVCDDDHCYLGCADALTQVDVPPHTQANVAAGWWALRIGRVPMDNSAKSWTLYLAGAPAEYDVPVD